MAEETKVETTKTATMHFIDTVLNRSRTIWMR